jgi:intracellular septation protein A
VAAAILVFGAYTIETSNIKLVGANVTAVLVLGGLFFVFGQPLQRWLTD